MRKKRKPHSKFYKKNWERFDHEINNPDSRFDKDYVKLIALLYMERISRNMSQTKLSELSGLSPGVISKIEILNVSASMESIIKYARGLNYEIAFWRNESELDKLFERMQKIVEEDDSEKGEL